MVQNVAIPIPSINIADAELEVSSFKEIPLTAMSENTRRQLSGLLNTRTYNLSDGGYCRDWRGIAAITQNPNFFDESAISVGDPTRRVLEEWCNYKPKDATFANLQEHLGTIDRWDASDDIYENLVEDARKFKAKLRKVASTSKTKTVEQSNTTSPIENDADILTVDDKQLAELGLQPQRYDAFVLYADVDAKYAAEIKSRLEENNKSNFKLCFKDNVLAGKTFLHVVLTQIIELRCNHLIVIFTKEFLKSPEDEFLVDYTQAVQIKNSDRKIIPLIYDEDVELPRTLTFVTHLKYNAINYWDRLAASITSEAIPPIIKDNKLIVNRSSEVPSQLSPSLEIPSINITYVQDNDAPTIKEPRNFKKHITRATTNHNYIANGNANSPNSENINSKLMNVKGLIRHAHSTSQLNGKNYKERSSSNESIKSNGIDNLKQKKGIFKKFKKVFSRSNNKLHTAV